MVPHAACRNNYGGVISLRIRAGILPAERPRGLEPCLETLWEILEHCWNQGPTRRPSAASLLAWFEEEVNGGSVESPAPEFAEEATLEDEDTDSYLSLQDVAVAPSDEHKGGKSGEGFQGPGGPNTLGVISTILVPVLIGYVVPRISGL